ncbi:exodeoxyribonuclease III [Patescibacteria group bacterium]|jgi:exodeoxyribonuclease-3|nr:exodeoxyribonuclease III [Patescibacteria group bacterium]
MKIITWNINGWRAIWQKGLANFVERYQPDLLGLQETKMSDELATSWSDKLPGYNIFWHGARRPGYGGTAVIAKQDLADLQVINGLGQDIFDQEGRSQICELPDFYWLNIYFPNAGHELGRLDYKQNFNEYLRQFVANLRLKKPVIMSGDFNVAHQPIDLANPKTNEGNAGYTQEERQFFSQLLSDGFIDIWRYLHPNEIQYTWWTYRFKARSRNIGWRIDYFLLTSELLPRVKSVTILDQEMGSDHCPVELIII